MKAVMLIRSGWSVRQTARYIGVVPGTVSKWTKKAPVDGRRVIPTESSRPHSHPNAISPETEQLIIDLRKQTNRCSQVIWHLLKQQGVSVSLSTVNRVLKRRGLVKRRSPWKRLHRSLPRPKPQKPGDLVQVDTIHLLKQAYRIKLGRFYIYTLLDVYSPQLTH